MNVEDRDDYREGLFWLIGGLAFVMTGMAQFGDWHGIQSWFFYTLGVGLFIVTVIVAPRKTLAANRLRRLWLPLIVALVVSVVLAAVSAEVGFVSVFPLVLGLILIGSGLWLTLRRGPK